MDTRTLPDSIVALPRQHTSFIGRETEIAEITALLADPHCQLLTLVGPGGCGKTRLGIETAARMADAFADGVFFVPLQPLQSSDQVTGTTINVLNFRPDDDAELEQALLDYLHDRHLLLLLDNFEHLMGTAALVTAIVDTAPNVKLLVTSREPLNLREEWVREVGGLAYPHNGTVSAVDGYSALELFVARARQLRVEFSLEAEYDDVVRICQLVDGLPLAVELAAGWLRTLSCAAIASQIEDNADILASSTRNLPERHRSMRAVFAHSWWLMTDEERAVLPRFSVYRGGCTREAAEQVAGATLPMLASLVEKSLLRHDPDTDRYDMQELLRQYAQAQLEDSGEGDRVRDSHAHYYATLFHGGWRTAFGPAEALFMNMIHTELDNIRVSWGWALDRGSFEVVDQLVDTLWMYFSDFNPRTFEMGALCQAAVKQLNACTGQRERAILGRVLARQGKWAASVSQIALAETCFRQSMTIAREQDDLAEYYYGARWLAWHILARYRSEYHEALSILEDCVTFYREQDRKHLLGLSLSNLALVCGKLGQVERQQTLLQEAYRLFESMDMWRGMTEMLSYLGGSATDEGRWAEAKRYLSALMERTKIEMSDRGFRECALKNLVMVSAMQGDFTQARQFGRTLSDLRGSRNDTHYTDFHTTHHYRLSQSLMFAADGASVEALQLADETIASSKQRGGVPELVERGRVIRAWVLCDLERFDAASQELVEALSAMLAYYRLSADLMLAIATAARVLARRGQHVRAAKLLGLVFTCPNSPQGYLERHQGIIQLRADLEAQLGAEAFAAAWERGVQLDVETVTRDLLCEFSAEADDPIAKANKSLDNPLTSRELDVLALLADGLTNPQIAERLFITTGTVKGHVNKILHKLDAADRQEAVSQARTQQLLKA